MADEFHSGQFNIRQKNCFCTDSKGQWVLIKYECESAQKRPLQCNYPTKSSSVGQINEIQYRKETPRHSMWKTADATESVSIHGHGDNNNNGRWRNQKGSGVPAIGYRRRRLSTATTVNN